MHDVQATLIGGHKGPGTAGTAIPARLLEDSDGVVRLYFSDDVLAESQGSVSVVRCTHAYADWLQWRIERLHWRRPQALKLLQGASLQQLFGPRYSIVRATTFPLYDPLPRLEHLELAELVEAYRSFSRQSFYEFVQQLRDSIPPRS